MPILIIAALAFIASSLFGLSLGPSGDQFLKEPKYQPISQVCLDEETAKNGLSGVEGVPDVLKGIKKPTRDQFIGSQVFYDPQCESFGKTCDHPDEADYIVVATNVKLNPVVFPNSFKNDPRYSYLPDYPSDRQILRYRLDEVVSSDSETQAKIRGRIFRTHCADWCHSLGRVLPYLGSFHCDFVFYLHDTDERGEPQIDANGKLLQPNEVDPENLPRNGSIFSIYFRKGGTIPKKIQCPAPTEQPKSSVLFDQDVQPVRAQEDQSGFTWPPGSGKEWLYRRESELKNTEVNVDVKPYLADPNDITSNIVKNPLTKLEGDFEVFLNLSFPSSESILYLVEKGEYTKAKSPLLTPRPTQPPAPTPTIEITRPIIGIKFKEFHLLKVVQPTGRSLQLGTFFPPNAADWIKSWYDESKPAIYLYPERDTLLSVRLNPAGQLTVSDPPYDTQTGWKNFLAHPDGTLTYQGKTYPYLYYEANLSRFPIGNEGFVIAGSQLLAFFYDVLPKLGLQGREIDEFIDYWMGRLDTKTPYYFISFLSRRQIEAIEPLVLSQKPDTEIRMRAYFKPLIAPIDSIPQKLAIPPQRRGFTLVEWGGILDK